MTNVLVSFSALNSRHSHRRVATIRSDREISRVQSRSLATQRRNNGERRLLFACEARRVRTARVDKGNGGQVETGRHARRNARSEDWKERERKRRRRQKRRRRAASFASAPRRGGEREGGRSAIGPSRSSSSVIGCMIYVAGGHRGHLRWRRRGRLMGKDND